jgi:hypothetical protein
MLQWCRHYLGLSQLRLAGSGRLQLVCGSAIPVWIRLRLPLSSDMLLPSPFRLIPSPPILLISLTSLFAITALLLRLCASLLHRSTSIKMWP